MNKEDKEKEKKKYKKPSVESSHPYTERGAMVCGKVPFDLNFPCDPCETQAGSGSLS